MSDPRASGAHRFESPGQLVLGILHAAMQIEEDWTLWNPDGFTWWGSVTAQKFRLREFGGEGANPYQAIEVQTDLFRNVATSSPAAAIAIAYHHGLNQCGIAAIDDGHMRLHARVEVLPGQESTTANLLAERALMHLVIVEQYQASAGRRSPSPPQVGEIDMTWPPNGRLRSDVHQHLQHVLARLEADPQHAVRPYRGLDDAASVLTRYGQPASGGNTEGWVSAVQHYLTPTPQGPNEATPVSYAPFAELGSTEVRIDAGVRHPLFGAGVVVRLGIQVPDRIDNPTAAGWAETFNTMEVTQDGPRSALGSWNLLTPQPTTPRRHWIHGTFHPSAMPFRIPGNALGTIAVQRSQWWMRAARKHVATRLRPS